MGYSKQHVAGCLRAARAKADKSRDTVAAESGIPASTLASYENAETGMSLENAWRLADYYGKTLDELLEHVTN